MEHFKKIGYPFLALVAFFVIIFGSIWIYAVVNESNSTEPAYKEWVYTTKWDCPTDHPIKANMNSGIYHVPGGTYYDRTNGQNTKCYDTAYNAELGGFRASKR